jgi:hypothetical protein
MPSPQGGDSVAHAVSAEQRLQIARAQYGHRRARRAVEKRVEVRTVERESARNDLLLGPKPVRAAHRRVLEALQSIKPRTEMKVHPPRNSTHFARANSHNSTSTQRRSESCFDFAGPAECELFGTKSAQPREMTRSSVERRQGTSR